MTSILKESYHQRFFFKNIPVTNNQMFLLAQISSTDKWSKFRPSFARINCFLSVISASTQIGMRCPLKHMASDLVGRDLSTQSLN